MSLLACQRPLVPPAPACCVGSCSDDSAPCGLPPPTHVLCPPHSWCEHDPLIIWGSVQRCIEAAVEKAAATAGGPVKVVSLGITNQRETTLVWSRSSGKPLYNAIVWLDNRTRCVCCGCVAVSAACAGLFPFMRVQLVVHCWGVGAQPTTQLLLWHSWLRCLNPEP